MLKHYIRDGNRKIIGPVTTGFSDESGVVRGARIRAADAKHKHRIRSATAHEVGQVGTELECGCLLASHLPHHDGLEWRAKKDN